MAFLDFKKETPLTPSSIPDLPKSGPPGAGGIPAPLKQGKAGLNKKIIVTFGVLLSVMLIGITSFIALRKQPQTTSSKAATANCVQQTVGTAVISLCPGSVSLSTDKTSAKAVFQLTKESEGTTTTATTVTVKQETFWCSIDNGGVCQDSPSSTSTNYTLNNVGDTQLITLDRASDNGQACGLYQFSADLGSGPLTQSVGTGTDCSATGLTPTVSVPPPVPPGGTITPTGTKTYSLSGTIYSSATPPANTIDSCTPNGTGLNGVNLTLMQAGVVVQKETTHDNTIAGGVVPGNYDFTNLDAGTYALCVTVPTGSQISCPVSISAGVSNCITEVVPPSDTAIVINLTSNAVPTIATSGAPTPTNSVGGLPTPTDIVVVITATPTPTLGAGKGITPTLTPTAIAGSQSATATPAAGTPTIPSAGSPLPYIAVGVPFVLILLAFIL